MTTVCMLNYDYRDREPDGGYIKHVACRGFSKNHGGFEGGGPAIMNNYWCMTHNHSVPPENYANTHARKHQQPHKLQTLEMHFTHLLSPKTKKVV